MVSALVACRLSGHAGVEMDYGQDKKLTVGRRRVVKKDLEVRLLRLTPLHSGTVYLSVLLISSMSNTYPILFPRN